MSVEEELKSIDPQKYFEYVKSKKIETSDEFLNDLDIVVEKELSKAMAVGQNLVVRRLAFARGVIEREHKLLEKGINTYVQRDDIEEFIQHVSDKAIKLVELELFPRSIPDTLAGLVAKLREEKLFDNFYILCTDYTKGIAKAVQQERKRKDPILFGTFENKIDNMWDIHDRFYFLGDWEDEYCDLTLNKMVEKMATSKVDGSNVLREVGIKTPSTAEIRSYINALEERENGNFRQRGRKKSFFAKVTELFAGK